MQTIIKSTQEQATAAWIDYLNQLRLDELVRRLDAQDISLENALIELDNLKRFVGDPEHILGSDKTKHGEIAENAQVYISNARKLVEGRKSEYTFDGVGRTAPEDYLHNGAPIQSKFYVGPSGGKTFGAIQEHLKKYPNFMRSGGEYEIPKDQYQNIIELLSRPSSQLSRSEANLVRSIREWEASNNVVFADKVKPSVLNYSDVQQGAINETIHKEEISIKETDQQRRYAAYQASKPTATEGAKASAVSAVMEGGVSFCMVLAKKRKEGKQLADFTVDDWKDLGTETGKGTLKGGIRGAAVYSLTNFTATPANVASAFVTAVFGVTSQANALRKGNITKEEFLINSETLCLEVSVSAIASALGQTIIPIPVLGAVIGNVAGMYMYEIAKEFGLDNERKIIAQYQNQIKDLKWKLGGQYLTLINQLEKNMRKFQSLMAFSFDPDVNVAFAASVELARFNGVPENKILKSKIDIDAYFLN